MKSLKKVTVSVASLVLLVGGVVGMSPAVFAADQPNCVVRIVGTTNNANGATSKIKLNATNTEASATVTVAGDHSCTQTVTIAAWTAPSTVFTKATVPQQKLVSSKTETFGVGTHTISTSMKDCYYQIDVLNSAHATAPDGSALYVSEDHMMGWAQGGTQSCEAPTPTQPPVNTTPAPTTPAPTALPNTGAGNTIALFSTVSIVAACFHKFALRKLFAKV